MEFKIGETVKLKGSNKPVMVVQKKESKGYLCRWYSEKEEDFKSRVFEPETLEIV